MGYRLLPEAEADIDAIAIYIAERNPSAARRWTDGILERCRMLGDMPGAGVARPDVRPDLRMFPVGRYLILYREADGGADIVRVVHEARRWAELI